MKKLILISLFIASANFIFAQDSKAERAAAISGAVENVIEKIGDISPENTSLLSQQPDAYIGKFFPSLPPHFAAGLTAAGTVVDTGWMGEAAKTVVDALGKSVAGAGLSDFNMDFNVPSKLFLPTLAASGRIGGFFLPFDIGIFGIATVPGMFKDIKAGDFSADFSYGTFGMDIRYAVLEGNVIIPKISVGGGYIFSRYEVGLKGYFSKDGTYSVGGSAYTGTMNVDSAINMKVDTHTIFAQVQASKKLLVLTPYIGMRTLFTCVRSDYDWNYDSYVTSGGAKKEVESNSASSNADKNFAFDAIQPQLFGGFDIQVAFFQLAVNAAWNMRSNYFSAGISANFKM